MKTTKHTFNKIAKQDNLFIKVKSSFNGMIDGCESYDNDFEAVEKIERNIKNTHGINGAWLVNGGRDYFENYEDDNFKGIYVYNSCGSFVIATKK
tara:strand:+ start:2270 stop:2554 length:285 start_codon:yes stop_codon:yes gene_type:complete